MRTASSRNCFVGHCCSHAAFCVRIADAELRDRPHLPANPGSEDFTALLLTQSRAREVSKSNESNNVKNELVFVEDSVDNHGDKRGEESTRANLGDKHQQGASLEDGTEKSR